MKSLRLKMFALVSTGVVVFQLAGCSTAQLTQAITGLLGNLASVIPTA